MRRMRAVSEFLSAGTKMKLHRAQIQAITLGIIIFFINSVQNLITPNLSAAAHEFGYNEFEKDQKLGANLAFAYFTVRIPVSMMCGCTMDFDFINRVRVLQVAVFITAVSCLSTYSAASYKQLLACRFFTGLGVSAATSVTFSILFDIFERQREIVNTAVFLSITAGIAFGNLIAGAIEYHGHWRSPFWVASIPAFLCLLALQFLVQDPARGSLEEGMFMLPRDQSALSSSSRCGKLKRVPSYDIINPPLLVRKLDSIAPIPTNIYDEQDATFTNSMRLVQADEEAAQEKVTRVLRAKTIGTATLSEADTSIVSIDSDDDVISNTQYMLSRYDLPVLGTLFRTYSILLIFSQVVMSSLVWGISAVFLNDYLSSTRGLSLQSATLVVTSFFMGHIVGYIAGGWAGEHLRHHHSRLMISIMLCASLLQLIPFLYLLRTQFDATSTKSQPFHFMGGWAGFLFALNVPMNRYLLQSVTFPEDRALCLSLNSLLEDIFLSCGPLLIVALIRSMGSRCQTFCFIVVLVSVLNATLIAGLLFFFHADAYAVQRHVADLGGGGEKFSLDALDQEAGGVDGDRGDNLSDISNKSVASEGKEGDSDTDPDNSEFLIYDETPTKGNWVLGFG